ncbi:MAG TPA: MgtC/SapB family protein [Candidatus Saccharimonadales bacterium]|jgi:putative Mg2+ transporter-C (MgtC) family protein
MSGEELSILLKVIVAVCLGGVIGIERELSRKPAGIRTHMFVAGAAALLLSISTVLIEEFASVHSGVSSDPVRVIEAIVVGISFIGAGTVLKSASSHHVYYLTTAASILFAAAIGITVGLEKYGLAGAITVLVVLINSAVGALEQRYLRKNPDKTDDVDAD